MILSSTGQEEMVQRGREGKGGGAQVIYRGLFEGCCGFWQEQLKQHQNCSISRHPLLQPAPRSAEVRRRWLPITKSEVSTPPTIVNRTTLEWLHPSSSPPTPLSLFTILWLYLTGGLQVGFITHLTHPHPTELYPRRCLWASWQDVRPTRRSKPFWVNVLLLTMTFSTLIGLTSQTHAKLGLQ